MSTQDVMARASAPSPLVFALLLSALPGCWSSAPEASNDDTGESTEGGTSEGCPVGAEGCPCTDGGGCDPGLTCLSQLCVDASDVSSTSESGGSTTGDSATDDSTTDGTATDDTTTGDTSDDPDSPLIDNLEDGDSVIHPSEGRVGSWYTFNDGSGSQSPSAGYGVSPAQGGFMGSQYAAHTVGQGFSGWGAGMGLDFLNPQLQDQSAQPYDASGYEGLEFWVRGSGSVIMSVAIEEVVPESAGGSCTEDCYNKHGFPIELADGWHKYVVTWAQLEQDPEGGGLVDFDPTTIMALDFQFGADDDFDLWVDDVAFF